MEPFGILLLHKEAGMTSHTACARARRLLGVDKTGHTGTLDPMAMGLLPILVGRGVKAAEYMIEKDKRYRATMTLGLVSDTEDSTGQVREVCPPDKLPEAEAVLKAVSAMRGVREQVPPMYSAVQVGGVRLMDLARKGETVDRPSRTVEIYDISAKPLSKSTYEVDVHCSKGTYIRTLCAEIGQALGCGAIMSGLVRTQVSGFALEDAVTLGELEQMTPARRLGRVLSLEDTFFASLPAYTYPPFYETLAKNGARVLTRKLKGCPTETGARVRLRDSEGMFALGEVVDTDEGPALAVIKRFRI